MIKGNASTIQTGMEAYYGRNRTYPTTSQLDNGGTYSSGTQAAAFLGVSMSTGGCPDGDIPWGHGVMVASPWNSGTGGGYGSELNTTYAYLIRPANYTCSTQIGSNSGDAILGPKQ